MRNKLFLLMAAAVVSVAAHADNWMSKLPNNAYVSVLSIPGSHDSATGCGWAEGWEEMGDTFARTQELDLAAQWSVGIRAFDLRPCVYEDYMNLNHGLVATTAHFEDALKLLCDSLRANPTEFAIIHLLHETDGDMVENAYNSRIVKLLKEEWLQDFLSDFRANLTVGDMRGKMLILSRDKYASTPQTGGFFVNWTGEVNWNRQISASITGRNSATAKMCVQDYSDTHNAGGVEKKVESIVKMLDFSTTRTTSRVSDIRWVFNFASAYSLVQSFFGTEVSLSDGYRDNATHTHAAIIDYLQKSDGGPTGVIMMDFVGVDRSGEYDVRGAELVRTLINNNFKYLHKEDEAKVSKGPTMGWSSWNTYGVNINESLIKRQAAAMVSKGLLDVGFDHINIDDGYFGGRDPETGQLLIHKTRFPNGLKPVADYIHAKGLRAGIYSDAGRNTCGSMFNGDTTGKGVGLYEHDQQDCDFFFKECGFDFIKVDFCGGSYYHNEDHLVLDEKERYNAIAKAIANTGREDVRMNACRWAYPGTWVNDAAFSWRTTGDINNSWGSVKDILAENLYMSAYCYDGHYNDMDMLEVGRSLTAEEDKTHFGMWCIMASPLLIGCDLTTIKASALALLKNEELIALNQDTLYLQAYLAGVSDGCYILVKDIETLQGTKRAFAVYNPNDGEKNATVEFSDIELGGTVRLRDVFQKKDLGEFTGKYEIKMPAHATRIYVAEAEGRLERKRYEAETAFISDYQEIKNNQAEKTGIYDTSDICSCGYKAGWLGYSEKNDLVWRDVYSQKGGEYKLTIAYITGESRSITVSVNGKTVQTVSVNSGGWSKVGRKTIKVNLQEGRNQIRLSNPRNWMPDIDYIELESTATEAVGAARLPQTGDGAAHDLQGRVSQSAAHGVVIKNGKKVLQ